MRAPGGIGIGSLFRKQLRFRSSTSVRFCPTWAPQYLMTCQARSHSSRQYTSGRHNSVSGTSRKCSTVDAVLIPFCPLHTLLKLMCVGSRLTNRKCSMPSVLPRGYFHRRPSERWMLICLPKSSFTRASAMSLPHDTPNTKWNTTTGHEHSALSSIAILVEPPLNLRRSPKPPSPRAKT